MKLYNPTDVIIPSVIQVGNVVKRIIIAPKSESKSLTKLERDHMKGIFPMLEDRPDAADEVEEVPQVSKVVEPIESEVEIVEVKKVEDKPAIVSEPKTKNAKEIVDELDADIFDDSTEEFISDPTKKK